MQCFLQLRAKLETWDISAQLLLFGGFMWVKQCHKPPIWEWLIHVYTTYLWWFGGWFMGLPTSVRKPHETFFWSPRFQDLTLPRVKARWSSCSDSEDSSTPAIICTTGHLQGSAAGWSEICGFFGCGAGDVAPLSSPLNTRGLQKRTKTHSKQPVFFWVFILLGWVWMFGLVFLKNTA